jgi:hypothetical protein
MSVIPIEANGRNWLFAPLPQAPVAARLQVVARAQFIDDITLQPPRAPLAIRSDSGLAAQVGPDGLAGLIGRPLTLAPPAQLAGLPLGFTLSAPAYDDCVLNGVLPAQPGLPNDFVALDFGLRRLLRAAAVVQGRVFRRVAGIFQPQPGAQVQIVAATPARALAGALPAPVAVGGLVGLTAVANADAEYVFAPLARFSTLTLRVMAPVAGPPVTIAAPAGGTDAILDFRLT